MLFLAQSDTTVGFLSKEPEVINRAKGRRTSQAVIQTFPDFKSLSYRIPKKYRRRVRMMQKTTFVLSTDIAFRVVPFTQAHYKLLAKTGPLFSSSANAAAKTFDMVFAHARADVVVTDYRGLQEKRSSKMLRLGKTRLRSIR